MINSERILRELAAIQADMADTKRAIRLAEARLSYASVRAVKLKRQISAALRAEREEANKVPDEGKKRAETKDSN